MLTIDPTPGRIVEFDGELYLVEDVKVRMTLQKIESASDQIEELYATGITAPKHPVFVQLEGSPDEPIYSPERFQPLYTEREL